MSEVGDVCWYLYGLCGALEDVTPETVAEDGHEDPEEEGGGLLAAVGPLCGAVKKWSRGDSDWAVFGPRVRTHVSRVLRRVARASPVPLAAAMRANIAKIESRRQRGVVRGDGGNR